MKHTREEVIERAVREFKALDALVSNLSQEEWERRLKRPESKDPWTVKDALAHITYWKLSVIQSATRKKRMTELRGMNITDGNHFVYEQWRDSSPQEVLAWHRKMQEELLEALRNAPEVWFDRERGEDWPYDMDGHSRAHRVKDIEKTLQDPGK
jgi:hypothetical protein